MVVKGGTQTPFTPSAAARRSSFSAASTSPSESCATGISRPFESEQKSTIQRL